MSKPLVCTLPGHTGPEGVCTCCLGCIGLRAERDEAREKAMTDSRLLADAEENVIELRSRALSAERERDALRAELAEAVGLLREWMPPAHKRTHPPSKGWVERVRAYLAKREKGG